jgi:arginine N-succinyltransferase
MLVVRSAQTTDLPALMILAQQVGDGMTTLKADHHMLSNRVERACASFSGELAKEERDYLFVMEDTSNAALAGVCAIKRTVGLKEPFYNYRIGTLVHSSVELNIFSQMETLYLSNDLTGSAELCSLFLHPDYRTGTNGRLLSKSRFLFMAQFPDLFPPLLIAEMRGYQRADGTSPFWENLGRHFFQMDFKRADDLSSLGKKSFIAELMPRHPLYVAYLSKEAQEVIGKVHIDTAPARHLLEQEGMFYAGYVDIFDGGPVLQARISDLRAVRESVITKVVAPPSEQSADVDAHLVATLELGNFRVIATRGSGLEQSVGLDSEQLAVLQCAMGESVRCLPIQSKKHAQ